MKTIDLTGRTAIITGASQGLGQATAEALHAAGANVVVNYFPDSHDKNKELAQETSKAFISALDKAQKTNLVHSNKVARKKARCSSLLAEI